MVAFTDPLAPRELRILRALEYMKILFGERAGQGPTNELYRELAERYDITTEEFATAWVDWGFGRR